MKCEQTKEVSLITKVIKVFLLLVSLLIGGTVVHHVYLSLKIVAQGSIDNRKTETRIENNVSNKRNDDIGDNSTNKTINGPEIFGNNSGPINTGTQNIKE